jgi:hypothetical protein
LERLLGARFATGIAQVLQMESGACIEPRDDLVDRSSISTVRPQLGKPVASDSRGRGHGA